MRIIRFFINIYYKIIYMKKKIKLSSINDEEFKKLITDNDSISDIIKKIGYTNSGAIHNRIKKRIDVANLDISHMNNKIGSRSGRAFIPIEEALIKNSKYKSNFGIKRKLVEEGYLEYECEKCKNSDTWMGESLTLHLDHINGVNNDNRRENLRLLCPNCHSQTDTYAGRNIKRRK